MRYHDYRTTLTKRVDDPRPDEHGLITTPFHEVTPAWQSAFNPDRRTVRHGVDSAMLLMPQHTRASRRASGQTRPRRRLPGVGLPREDQPWAPQPKDDDA